MIRLITSATTQHVKICEAIQKEWGPHNGKTPKRGSRFWLATLGGVPAAFAMGVFHAKDFWFRNCVVAGHARGKGIQRALIRARIAYAEAHGASLIATYTGANNLTSANNLIKCGFVYWGAENGWLYWRYKDLPSK